MRLAHRVLTLDLVEIGDLRIGKFLITGGWPLPDTHLALIGIRYVERVTNGVKRRELAQTTSYDLRRGHVFYRHAAAYRAAWDETLDTEMLRVVDAVYPDADDPGRVTFDHCVISGGSVTSRTRLDVSFGAFVGILLDGEVIDGQPSQRLEI